MNAALVDIYGLVGQRLDGKYEIEDLVVYRATHLTLRKPVAVKVLRVPRELEGTAREGFLEKFALEAQTIASLDHPAIVKVIDFGTSPMPVGETAPWMVLDWLQGQTLDAELDARRGQGGRTPAACLALLRPVFEALAYAHDEGIAHRDVKPANIMLITSKRGDRTARVLDFGIAKVMTGEAAPASGLTATHNHQRTFSLFYASPEQIAGTRTGPWTDVYALALVLTEMLTDAIPYRGEDVQDVYIDALSPVRPTPAKRGFDVGPWEPVLARAVSLKPAERYASAREFLTALEASVPDHVEHSAVDPSQRGPRPPVDTLQPSQSQRSLTPVAPPPRRSAARAIGYALLGALGAFATVATYRAFNHTERPVEVRVVADPNATSDASVSPAPAVVEPASSADAAAPIALVVDAGAPVVAPTRVLAPAVNPPRPVVRPVVQRPRAPTATTPATTTAPPATGHEIIPAE
jgi:eukaryotic-like serine/threonine-protein kinase